MKIGKTQKYFMILDAKQRIGGILMEWPLIGHRNPKGHNEDVLFSIDIAKTFRPEGHAAGRGQPQP